MSLKMNELILRDLITFKEKILNLNSINQVISICRIHAKVKQTFKP